MPGLTGFLATARVWEKWGKVRERIDREQGYMSLTGLGLSHTRL